MPHLSKLVNNGVCTLLIPSDWQGEASSMRNHLEGSVKIQDSMESQDCEDSRFLFMSQSRVI